MIESIENRKKTLLEILKFLIQHQPETFVNGKIGNSAVTLNAVAEKLAVHPSTVSRAVRGKYVLCPYGTIPLRQFFSRPSVVRIVSGMEKSISSTAVCQAIKKIVDLENAERPLTDEKIAALLNSGGIQISRRCVAKYRNQIGIKPSPQRKKL